MDGVPDASERGNGELGRIRRKNNGLDNFRYYWLITIQSFRTVYWDGFWTDRHNRRTDRFGFVWGKDLVVNKKVSDAGALKIWQSPAAKMAAAAYRRYR